MTELHSSHMENAEDKPSEDFTPEKDYLFGADGALYVKTGDNTIELAGADAEIDGVGISKESGLKPPAEDEVQGQHGCHRYWAWGPYYDWYYGCYRRGYHRH